MGRESKLQSILQEAVSKGKVPFAVGMVADKTGIRFQGAAGDGQSNMPVSVNSVFRIFSMTKAIGTTSMAILVERGLVSWDSPVDKILPEFANIKVLSGWDGDKPILRQAKTRATLRHLATHTSGLEYEFWSQDMADYLTKTGTPTILSGLHNALTIPMLTDPGTRFAYGINIDWLGLAVEQISGLKINDFLKQHLFNPLAMQDTDVEVRGDMAMRLTKAYARTESGGFVEISMAPAPNPEHYYMGHHLYSTPQDYMRFIRMFLNGGELDGVRVLKSETVSMMLANQIGDLSFAALRSVAPRASCDFDPHPQVRKTFSLGFMRNETDIDGKRQAGSQSWAGIMNSHYWFDPKAGLAAVIMTQTLPFVEPPFMQLYDEFERQVYQEFG